eukprot:gene11902-biopygen22928
MGFLPEEHEDTFWFLVAPLTTIPMAVYTAAGITYGSYPHGEPDWKASVRNTGIWGSIAAGVWGWNAIFHPGKYAFTSGTSAYKIAGHIIAPAAVPLLLSSVAVAAAIGYVSTAEAADGDGDVHTADGGGDCDADVQQGAPTKWSRSRCSVIPGGKIRTIGGAATSFCIPQILGRTPFCLDLVTVHAAHVDADGAEPDDVADDGADVADRFAVEVAVVVAGIVAVDVAVGVAVEVAERLAGVEPPVGVAEREPDVHGPDPVAVNDGADVDDGRGDDHCRARGG